MLPVERGAVGAGPHELTGHPLSGHEPGDEDERPLAYLGIKFHPDHRNRPVVETMAAGLETAGLRTVCVARDLERWGAVDVEPPDLMSWTLAAIDRAAVAIIELSEKGVGLGIEAGYARARSIPILVLHRDGTDVSATLTGIAAAIVSWDDDRSLADAAASAARLI